MLHRVAMALVLLLYAVGGAAQADSIQTLRLIFAGDIMGHESQVKSAYIAKEQRYDYTPCFAYVAPILRQADLAIGNLELTLPGQPPYTGYPMFRSPDALAPALRQAGFNLLLTANNHSNDAGPNGVISTLNTLENEGFYHTGTFRNAEERAAFYPLLVYKNNFKIAWLNYTYDTNGIPTKAPVLVNEIDETLIAEDMAVARALQPDFIIVVMHWGDEYQLTENKKQRVLAAKLADWGADLIIGAHPHVVQPIRTVAALLPDSTEKLIPVAYSLGNFISGQVKPHTDGGILLTVALEKNRTTGQTNVGQPRYIPVWRWRQRHTDGRQTYRVVAIAPFETDASSIGMNTTDHAAMLRYARAVRQNLADSQATEHPVDWLMPTPNAANY
ncbi:MAG TPA: CapA family protein [Saprospiraceae bacterium]|nr:CapA family protein [Saprospiraceae bacterium]HMP25443.1 CapA family protein [Saprospiraceae bacterium]